MFTIHIDGLDGSLDWIKPTLAEAIAVATGELKERRRPVNASITDTSNERVVWGQDITASGVVSKLGIAHSD
jgi:hypothetical protein